MKLILVPTDFTKAGDNAFQHALAIAKRSNDGVMLLHIQSNQTEKLLKAIDRLPHELETHLSELCKTATDQTGVKCEYTIVKGDIFEEINDEASNPNYRLMVIGTHGTRGVRQNLFGADILKIVRESPLPVIVVPKEAEIRNGYEVIVFPYGGHHTYRNKINATAFIAELFGSEVHIYSVDRPQEENSKQTEINIKNACKTFTEKGIPFKEVHEEQELFSPGFAKQTVNYAKKVNSNLISVMSVPSKEYNYISDSDKEYLINNSENITLLMTSNMY